MDIAVLATVGKVKAIGGQSKDSEFQLLKFEIICYKCLYLINYWTVCILIVTIIVNIE